MSVDMLETVKYYVNDQYYYFVADLLVIFSFSFLEWKYWLFGKSLRAMAGHEHYQCLTRGNYIHNQLCYNIL